MANSVSLRKIILLAALRLSAVWDLVTTFLGILLILDQRNVVAVSLAFVGTLIVVAFNFATRSIWRRRSRSSLYGLQILLLKVVWVMAMGVDLWTSMTCNAWFISLERPGDSLALFDLLGSLTLGQFIIVVFVTLVTAVSPMLVGYLRDKDIDILLD
jgi:hypothetical protein